MASDNFLSHEEVRDAIHHWHVDNGRGGPTVLQLVAELGAKEWLVRAHLRDLEKAGWIHSYGGGRRVKRYYVYKDRLESSWP